MTISYYLSDNSVPQTIEVSKVNKILSVLKIISSAKEKVLTTNESLLFSKLPETFSRKEAKEICINNKLSSQFFEISCRKEVFKKLFQKVDFGRYKKL